MRIHHIFHSGFLVNTRHSALLFDWYTGDLPQIPRDRRLYVFCSHAHADHYSPRIWELQIDHPEVIYILDEGIEDANHHPEARIVTVAPQMCYEIDGRIIRHCSLERWNYGSREEGESDPGSPGEDAAIRIHTLESTDMGVAFCVETEGRRIYHAGDLNVWYWNDEPMEDNIASEHKCCEQMQILADMYRHEPAQTGEGAGLHQDHGRKEDLIDVAFVPLDPRLEEHAPRCIAAFMDILGAPYVFPMHYWEREEEARAYLQDPRLAKYRDRIIFDRDVELF